MPLLDARVKSASMSNDLQVQLDSFSKMLHGHVDAHRALKEKMETPASPSFHRAQMEEAHALQVKALQAQIELHEDELDDMSDQFLQTQKALEDEESRTRVLSSELERLQSEQEDTRRALVHERQHFEEELAQLHSLLDKERQEKQALQCQLSETSQSTIAMQKQIDSLQTINGSIKEELETAKAQLSTKVPLSQEENDGEIADLNSQVQMLSTLKTQLSERMAQLIAMVRKDQPRPDPNQDPQVLLDKLCQLWTEALQDFKSARSQITSQSKKIKQQEKRIEATNKLESELRGLLSLLRSQIHSLQTDICSHSAELDRELQALTEQVRHGLYNSGKAMEQTQASLMTQIGALENELEVKNSDLSVWAKDSEKKDIIITQLSGRIQTLETAMKQSEEELQDQRSSWETITQEAAQEILRLEENVMSLTSAGEVLEFSKVEVEIDRDRLKEELEILQSHHKVLESDAASARLELKSFYEKLRQMKELLSQDLIVENMFAAFLTEKNPLTILEALSSRMESLQKRMAILDVEKAGTENRLLEFKGELSLREEELKEALASSAKYQQELETLIERCSQNEESFNDVRQKYDNRLAKEQEIENELIFMKEKEKHTLLALEAAERQLLQKREDVSRLHSVVEDHDSLKQEKDELQETVIDLKTERDRYKQDLETLVRNLGRAKALLAKDSLVDDMFSVFTSEQNPLTFLDSLRLRMDSLQTRLTTLDVEKTEVENKFVALRGELSLREEELEEALASSSRYQGEVERLTQCTSEDHAAFDRVRQEYSNSLIKIQELEQDVELLRKVRENMITQEEFDRLQLALTESTKELGHLEAQMNANIVSIREEWEIKFSAMVQEKDEVIQGLQESLKSLKVQTKSITGSLEAKLMSCQGQMQQMTEMLSSMSKTMTEESFLSRVIPIFSKDKDPLLKELSHFSERLRLLHKQMEEFEVYKAQKDTQFMELKANLSLREGELEDAFTTIQEQKQTIGILQEELTKQENDMEEMSFQYSEACAKISALESASLPSLDSELTSLQKIVEEKNVQLLSSQTQVDTLGSLLDATKLRLESTTDERNLISKELEQLKEALDVLRNEKDSITNNEKDLERLVAQLESRLQETSIQLERTNEAADLLEKRLEDITLKHQTEKQSLESEIVVLQEQISLSLSSSMEQVNQITELQQSLATKEEVIKQESENVKKLEQDLKSLQGVMDEIRQNSEREKIMLESDLDSVRTSSLQKLKHIFENFKTFDREVSCLLYLKK